MELARPRLLLPVLELHFSELDILWERRENAVFDSIWNLADLAELEQRARAHLDGLRIGQGHAADLAYAALEGDESGAATAAALVLLELGEGSLAELVERLSGAGDDVAHGIRSALRHRPRAGLEAALRPLVDSGSELARVCAADVLAFQRQPPPRNPRSLLEVQDADLRALALAALGRWRAAWDERDLRRELDPAKTPGEQRAALETSARLGLSGLADLCREAAALPEALAFLGVLGEVRDLERLEQALGTPALAGAALRGLGALGHSAAVPRLLEALEDPLSAHEAAAAFQRITGAAGLGSDRPLAPPPELPTEELDFWDDALEVDPQLGRTWWQVNGARFAAGRRWQSGLDVTEGGFGGAVHELTLEARRDVYLRLRHRHPQETPDVELERSAILQWREAQAPS